MLTEDIKVVLDKIYDHFQDKLRLIGNRAIAVSVFLFVSELIAQEKEDEIGSRFSSGEPGEGQRHFISGEQSGYRGFFPGTGGTAPPVVITNGDGPG